MARNKKNEADIRTGTVVTVLALCSLFVLLGVGYVWYKNQIDLLGRQIKERETHLADLERQNKMRRDRLAELCSPVALDGLVKKLNLGLVAPAKSQVIWMVEVPETEPIAGQAGPEGRPDKTTLAER